MDTQGGDPEFQPSGWPSESESEDPGHDPDALLREAGALKAEPSAGLGALEEPDRDGGQASSWKLNLCCVEQVQGALTQRGPRQMVNRQAPGGSHLFIMLHCDQACKVEGACSTWPAGILLGGTVGASRLFCCSSHVLLPGTALLHCCSASVAAEWSPAP